MVTILIACEGSFRLPKITSRTELKTALSRVGSLIPDDLLAVEVRAEKQCRAGGMPTLGQHADDDAGSLSMQGLVLLAVSAALAAALRSYPAHICDGTKSGVRGACAEVESLGRRLVCSLWLSSSRHTARQQIQLTELLYRHDVRCRFFGRLKRWATTSPSRTWQWTTPCSTRFETCSLPCNF